MSGRAQTKIFFLAKFIKTENTEELMLQNRSIKPGLLRLMQGGAQWDKK